MSVTASFMNSFSEELTLTATGQVVTESDAADEGDPGADMGNEVAKLKAPASANLPRASSQSGEANCPISVTDPTATDFVMVENPESPIDETDATADKPDTPVLTATESPKEWFKSVEFSERISGADVVVIHSDEDEIEVFKFKQLLTKFVTLPGNRKIIFFPSSVPQWDKVKWFEAALEHSKFKFIFVNQHVDDPFLEHQHHSALWKKIQCRDQSIVPVKAHFNVRLPSLLSMFRAIEIAKLLRGKALNDIDDVGKLTDGDVDLYFFNSVYRMFSAQLVSQSQQQTGAPANVHKFVSRLQPNYKYMVDHMDPDNGLLAQLLSVGVLTPREMETIRAEKTFFDRNEHLLGLFMTQRKTDEHFEKFLDALKIVDQHHLAERLLQMPPSSPR